MVGRFGNRQPGTVIAWHRAGFRLYWRWRSRARGGRPTVSEEFRTLISQIASENLDWGAPKIHGELLKLGFEVSERTVARYLRRLRPRRGDPAQRWLTFLANHREAIVAFDFFTVPTLTFRLQYCFFVIEHARRKVLHYNVTLFIQPLSGLCNNCGRRFPKLIRIGMSSSTTIPNSRLMRSRY